MSFDRITYVWSWVSSSRRVRGSWGRLYCPKAVVRLSQQFSKLKSVKSIIYKRYLLTSFVGPGVGAGVGGFEGAGVDCIIKKQSII